MSNLKADAGALAGLDMTKAIISLWFRIPQETIDKALEDDNFFWEFPSFQRVIPLLTWGPQPKGTIYDFDTTTQIFPDEIGTALDKIVGSHTNYQQPSLIGIKLFDTGKPHLIVNLQTADHAKTTATAFQVVNYLHRAPPEPSGTFKVVEDASFTSNGEFDYFGDAGTEIENCADRWHHLLMSWDLSGGSAVHGSGSDDFIPVAQSLTSFSKMWCAVDDVNKDKFDLPAAWCEDDANGIISHTCSRHAGHPETTGITGIGPDDFFDFGNPTVELKSPTIPVNPICIPSDIAVRRGSSGSGDSKIITPNLHIELAELQIFAGISLDTSLVSNRRLFIDKDGKPELDYSLSEQALGKKPEIRIHGSSNWRRGRNTGTLAELDVHFEKTGKIKGYNPRPSLHGPQGR